jgi:excisionase family DNA binding protein
MLLTREGRCRDSALAAPHQIKVRPNAKGVVQLEAIIVVGREASAAGASMPVEYFVDDTEIARMLGIHHRTVQQMARDGVIPAYPLGEGMRKTWRFLRSEIHEWMQARVSESGQPDEADRDQSAVGG